MPEPFKFKPFQAKVSTKRTKTYICRYCGAEKPASDMVYVGSIMEPTRKSDQFACKEN